MTRAAVRADGEIDGLHVVGFHGSVAPDRTPALKAALYGDASGRLCTIVDRDPRGRWVEIETSQASVDLDLLRGDGTILENQIPAHIDWGFIVLGRDELTHVDALASAIRDTDREPVRAIISALGLYGPRLPPSPELQKTVDGTWAWYCSLASATALRSVIRRAAKQVLLRVLHAQDENLEQVAWWLQRAAADEEDVLLACAALEQAGVDRWLTVAKALLPGRDGDWIDEHIRQAQDRLRPTTPEADEGAQPHAAETPWCADVRDVLERVFAGPEYSIVYRSDRVDVRLEEPHHRVLSIELDPTAAFLRPPDAADRGAGTAGVVVKCPAAVPKADLFMVVQSWRATGVPTRSWRHSSPPTRREPQTLHDVSHAYYDVDQGRRVAPARA